MNVTCELCRLRTQRLAAACAAMLVLVPLLLAGIDAGRLAAGPAQGAAEAQSRPRRLRALWQVGDGRGGP